MVNMSQPEKSNDDCYFYYYSTCTKGNDCPYRHSEAALGSETVCTHWRDGKCARQPCKYRHMDTSRINRASVQCWFETQPTGCRKPHCVFMHRKPRNLDTDDSKASDRLILPLVATTATSNVNSGSANNEGVNELGYTAMQATAYNPSKMKLIDDEDDYINNAPKDCSPPPIVDNNVDPFSISITDCEEEESDNELSKSDAKNDQKSDAFGVKTLEQIRMEKVFKQSENDCPIMDMNDTVPKPDTTANKTPVKTTTNKDLRVRIKRKVDSELRITAPNITEKITENVKNDPSLANFGVKTLEQIRKERLAANILEESEKIVGSSESDASIKEDLERRGEKRTASTDGLNVVKIRRSGPTAVQKITNENISDNCENVSSTGVELINTVSSSSCAVNNNGVNSSNNNNVNNKQRIKSLDADIEDDYDFLDGDSNIDTNNIDDDEDDELMREINQVINS